MGARLLPSISTTTTSSTRHCRAPPPLFAHLPPMQARASNMNFGPSPPLSKGRSLKAYSLHSVEGDMDSSKCREASLVAQKKERIKLPDYARELGRGYSMSEFLNDPSGVEAILNLKALDCFQPLDSHTYRCTLQKIQFMRFEVIPILDLQVTYADNGCKIEMLSCKFEGSELLRQQSKKFSACMRNFITWEDNASEPYLEFDVCLMVILQVNTKPFTWLPISAIEGPGKLVLQGLVDRLVSILSEQLLQDYEMWVANRSKC